MSGEILDNSLTISGTKADPWKGAEIYNKEIPYGDFNIVFQIPRHFSISQKDISRSFKDGVLTIEVSEWKNV